MRDFSSPVNVICGGRTRFFVLRCGRASGKVSFMPRTETMPMQKRPRGRPPVDEPMQQISIRMPADLLEEIDAIVEARYGQTDRASVIREILAEKFAEKGRRT